MDDPILAAVAAALAGKAAEAVAAGGRAAWSALVRRIREKAADNPDATRALDAAEHGAGGDAVAELARHLHGMAVADPTFGAEVRRLWAEASALAADHGSVVNTNSGTVHGVVVQAGEIHGGVHFGTTPPGT